MVLNRIRRNKMSKKYIILDENNSDLLKKNIKPILPKGFKFIIDKTRKCWLGYIKKEK